jgi:hypothetical protein
MYQYFKSALEEKSLTYHPCLCYHDTILVRVVRHSGVPTSEVSKHNITFLHCCLDRWANRSTSLYSFWSNRTSGIAYSLLLLHTLVVLYCCLGCDCLAGLVRVGMRSKPELGGSIFYGEVDKGRIGDD